MIDRLNHLSTIVGFCDVLLEIAEQSEKDIAPLKAAPVEAPVRRLDEVGAARKPVLTWAATSSS